MAEDSGRESNDRQKAHRADRQPAQPGGVIEDQSAPGYAPASSDSLLGDPRLNGRGNGPVKAALMRQAQQTYGNRALRRMLQAKSAAGAVNPTSRPQSASSPVAASIFLQRMMRRIPSLGPSLTRSTWSSTNRSASSKIPPKTTIGNTPNLTTDPKLADLAKQLKYLVPTEQKLTKQKSLPSSDALKISDKLRKDQEVLQEVLEKRLEELGPQIKEAIKLRGGAGIGPGGGCTATEKGGRQTVSGWAEAKGFVQATEKVMAQAKAIGHTLQPAGYLDRVSDPKTKERSYKPGIYNASHAEKQMAVVAPGEPIGVSLPMCNDCIKYFCRLALHQGKVQMVADPNMLNIFFDDGSTLGLLYDHPAIAKFVSE